MNTAPKNDYELVKISPLLSSLALSLFASAIHLERSGSGLKHTHTHITQQACAIQFFLSIKVISKSSEALLCQERRVKRGESDGWAERASHQEKVSLPV